MEQLGCQAVPVLHVPVHPGRTVFPVADDRKPGVGQLHADLMGSAGLDFDAAKGESTGGRHRLRKGLHEFPVRPVRNADQVPGLILLHPVFQSQGLLHFSADDGQVVLPDASPFPDHFRERLKGGVVLRKQHQPGGVPVQPVHRCRHKRFLQPGHIISLLNQIVDDLIGEVVPPLVPVPVGEQILRLHRRENILVLVGDAEGALHLPVFPDFPEFLQILVCQVKTHLVPGLQHILPGFPFPVHLHVFPDRLVYETQRCISQILPQKLVQPLISFVFADLQFNHD